MKMEETTECSDLDVNAHFKILETAITVTVNQIDDLELQSFCNEESEKIVIVITRKMHVYFPINPKPLLRDTQSELKWKELNCYPNPVRIVISGCTLKASLQVFGIEIENIQPVIEFKSPLKDICKTEPNQTPGSFSSEGQEPVPCWTVNPGLMNLLKKVSSYGHYRLCEGFTEEQLKLNLPGSVKPTSLKTLYVPFYRLESPHCSKLIKPGQCKSKNICMKCFYWEERFMYRNNKKIKIEIDEDDVSKPLKILETNECSKRGLAYLSPNNLRERVLNIIKARDELSKQVAFLQEELSKTVDKPK